jgi:GTP-binding protein YchF
VVRCFEDADITHVEGSVNPLRDAEIIETELILSDLESVDKRMPALEKKAKGGDKIAAETVELLKEVRVMLDSGKPARNIKNPALRNLQLITAKPLMYVCNVKEDEAQNGNSLTKIVEGKAAGEGASCVVISAKIESEIAQLGGDDEKLEFLKDIGLTETGLSRLIRSGYKLLNLITFFTVGPKEARAWTVKQGAKAPEGAGVIHTDFEKGFIRAETIAFPDYVSLKGEAGAKDAGKLRLEGKEYVVQDGDIMHFRFNV